MSIMTKFEIFLMLFIIITGLIILSLSWEREDKVDNVSVYKNEINKVITKSNAVDLCKDFSNIKPIQW